ncbi:hypothetical protein B0A55_08330 [Friedmanniomyces simplex]|uniref:Calcineurin-like phosphoesterase domain-containing protein n=1 Tax=Friedmanniomyces simplex TaxID=329884 RepID=A0A4U0X3B1_9PEZI|nr:hypothetical protein B0A55_08330 [Friedmanniomyces simplex]
MPSILSLLAVGGFAASQTMISQLHDESNANFNSTPAYQEALLATVNATERASDCDSCYSILRILKSVAELGEAPFAEISIAFCKVAHESDPDVCDGLETLEAPSVSWALRQMDIPSRTAQVFCEALYGLCPQPPVLNYTVPFPKSKPANATRPEVSRLEPIRVVHISDMHVDHSYTVGASCNCSKSICCRPYNATFAAGSQLANLYPAEPYGEYYCDTPVDLEEAQYAGINQFANDRAFVISTGDMVEGFTWGTSDAEIVYDVSDIYHRMRRDLGQVFPAMGNHDTNPVNSFPPAGLETSYNTTYDYNTHAELWEHWIGADAAEQVRTHSGMYSSTYTSYMGACLRILSINTMFWEGVNWWIYSKVMQRDPSGVLAFLVSQLQIAEDNGERAWIIGHIPPGRSDALYDYSSYLDQVVERYDGTIAAMFWGHTHRDQFEISRSDYINQTAANANMVGYIAPSLTPTSGNPNFRAYSVDPVTFGILDYTVYASNLSAPDFHTSGPKWSEYYAFKSAYGSHLSSPYTDPLAEMTPAFVHNVTTLFQNNDTLFQEYYDRKQRGWTPAGYGPCEGTCKADEICQLRSAQSQFACITPSAALKKREEESGEKLLTARVESECSGTRMVGVLHAMARNLETVSGGTGFIGSRTPRYALEKGYNVRAAVRSEAKAESVRNSPGLKNIKGSLEIAIVPDILASGAFDEAIKASSTSSTWLPAVKGTVGILDSAKKGPGVKKVVITSSVVAMPPLAVLIGKQQTDRVFTAIDRVRKNEAGLTFDTITIHPGFIGGRSDVVKDTLGLLSGSNLKFLAPVLGKEATENAGASVANPVDVGDVAKAHIESLRDGVVGSQAFLLTNKGGGVNWNDAKTITAKHFLEVVETGQLPNDGAIEENFFLRCDIEKTEETFGKLKGFEDTIKGLVSQYLELLAKDQK